MKNMLLLLVLMIFVVSNSNGQSCQWAEKIAGTSYDYAQSTVVDANGNVYVAGYFYSATLTLNNGKTLTNSGINVLYNDKFS